MPSTPQGVPRPRTLSDTVTFRRREYKNEDARLEPGQAADCAAASHAGKRTADENAYYCPYGEWFPLKGRNLKLARKILPEQYPLLPCGCDLSCGHCSRRVADSLAYADMLKQFLVTGAI